MGSDLYSLTFRPVSAVLQGYQLIRQVCHHRRLKSFRSILPFQWMETARVACSSTWVGSLVFDPENRCPPSPSSHTTLRAASYGVMNNCDSGTGIVICMAYDVVFPCCSKSFQKTTMVPALMRHGLDGRNVHRNVLAWILGLSADMILCDVNS